MGCCSSADVNLGGIKKFNFEKTNCASIDGFFDQAKALQDEVGDISDSIRENKETLATVTQMNLEPGANLANMTQGMILAFGANVGRFEDLSFNVLTESPYIEIVPPAIPNGNAMKEGLISYINKLKEVATDKIPGLAQKA